VVQPLLKLVGEDTYPLFIVIIDALDECEGENDIRMRQILKGHLRAIKSVAFSPDGKLGVVRQDDLGLGRRDGSSAADSRDCRIVA
jgi:hypothetical protein